MPLSLAVFTTIELLIVSWFDFKTKLIKNFWPILNIGFSLLFFLVFPDQFKFNLNHFIVPGLILLIGFILYALKVMGAGDGKFLFSLVLIIPTQMQLNYLEILAVTTVLISGAILIFRRVREGKWIRSKNIFAPIIFISWVAFLCQQKLSF